MKPEKDRLLDWLARDDTGLSSKTIAHVLAGTPEPREGGKPPQDLEDLGRCLRLLKLLPEWRARLPEIGKRYPEWEVLVANWDHVAAIHGLHGSCVIGSELERDARGRGGAAIRGLIVEGWRRAEFRAKFIQEYPCDWSEATWCSVRGCRNLAKVGPCCKRHARQNGIIGGECP